MTGVLRFDLWHRYTEAPAKNEFYAWNGHSNMV